MQPPSQTHSRDSSGSIVVQRQRNRSGTSSSTQTSRATDDLPTPTRPFARLDADNATPTRRSISDITLDGQITPEPTIVRKIASGASLSAMRPSSPPRQVVKAPASLHATDESDTDFQSAYSASPRDSYGSSDGEHEQQGNGHRADKASIHELPDDFGKPAKPVVRKYRERDISGSTTSTRRA